MKTKLKALSISLTFMFLCLFLIIPTESSAKMFGHHQDCDGCHGGETLCVTTYTIFWIKFRSVDLMPC